MDLSEIIVECLTGNDFVSLPGIGSFVQKYQPAKISADGKTFDPPQQIIIFDTSRTFDDGAIDKYLTETKGLNHTEATQAINIFLDSVRLNLNSGNGVSFRGIGLLKKEENNTITLTPPADQQNATQTFGLEKLSVEPHIKPTPRKATATVKSQKKNNTKGVLFTLASIFLLVCLFLAFYFIPSLRFWENSIRDQRDIAALNPNKANVEQVLATDSSQLASDTCSQMVRHQATGSQFVPKSEVREPTTQYFIIVGSFSSLDNARHFASSLEGRNGIDPEIISGRGKFRVSRGRYNNKEMALSELARLRQEFPMESAWLLIQ